MGGTEKRGLDREERGAAYHYQEKRPRLASVIQAVMDGRLLLAEVQRKMEPTLRKIVREEVQIGIASMVESLKREVKHSLVCAVENTLPRVVEATLPRVVEATLPRVVEASMSEFLRNNPVPELGTPRMATSPRQEGSVERRYRLRFNKRLKTPLFTGSTVLADDDSQVVMELVDEKNHVISVGPEASAKVDIVVLEGDFRREGERWGAEEFDAAVIKERPGRRPLITGDQSLTLRNGRAVINDLSFTDNSSWIRSRKFQLGARMADDTMRALVKEAKTESFGVKDHRGELYRKHYPPSLRDDVWRLERIGKDGAFHKRLASLGVHNVEDFLRVVTRDTDWIRKELGNAMSNRMWEDVIAHAKTVILNGKFYIYWLPGMEGRGVLLDNIYQVLGFINPDNSVTPVDKVPDEEKPIQERFKEQAYADYEKIVEHDGRPLIDATTGQAMPRPINITAAGKPPDAAQSRPANAPEIVVDQRLLPMIPTPRPVSVRQSQR
ncbi:hypothetical protein CBR_g7 [Chara braunii]|uniref:Uncharacterized protein n=1 Tax=Chara braunii TaxID=69332 RepID=A0A388JLB3_CHABU|nr:hypothetical protein CBR_g7 [Chara braunii]|eukprot:GBG58607.1 hypothetical protein CBR_g7 [Chara braunii]